MYTYRVTLDKRVYDIAKYELNALVDAYGVKASIDIHGNRCIINSRVPLDAIFLRAALIIDAEKELGYPDRIDWNAVFTTKSRLGSSIPYTYKVEKIYADSYKKDKILRLIHESICKVARDAKASLRYPQIVLRAYEQEGNLVIFQRIITGREIILRRQPKYRPYAPPASMDSILARALVNMTKLVPGEIFLDPFCGTGSLVIEASAIGLVSYGSDINSRFVEVARMLVEYYGFKANLRVADARDLPHGDDSIDGIATDPPYGISSPTYGEDVKELYQKFIVCLLYTSPSPRDRG